jgi:hypothetical protein
MEGQVAVGSEVGAMQYKREVEDGDVWRLWSRGLAYLASRCESRLGVTVKG